MKKLKILFFSILFAGCASMMGKENRSPFSEKEIAFAAPVPIPTAIYLESIDGIKLAYREYVPNQIDAVLIFYHGAIGHSAAMYQHIGDDLKNNYNILTVTPDRRGHGLSEGPRGDAPSPEHVLEDISIFVREIKNKYPNKLIFLGGHSAGAGALLNYSSYIKREKVAGYIFIAPYLGWRSETHKENPKIHPAKEIKVDMFRKNALYGGFGNQKAVFYNISDETLKRFPEFVPAITVNMSNAIDPTSPAQQLKNLDTPMAVWVGSEDEAFDVPKMVSFIKQNNPKVETKIIEGEKHLSIILVSSKYIGDWIKNFLSSQPAH